MAIGDVLSFTVAADGWFAAVVIEGHDVGGTYDWGFGTDNSLDAPSVVVSVTSDGYDSTGALGTNDREVYGTIIRRLVTPNEAQVEEVEAAGNVTLTIALSDFIYNDDTFEASVLADWYTDLIEGGNNAGVIPSAVNNSTLDYPTVKGCWDGVAGVMTADRVTAAFKMAALAFHNFGIAAVKFTATGQTSLNVETETISVPITEAYTASGLFREFYRTADIVLTDFTDDELIDLRFQAYPVVGDADSVLDTNNFITIDDEGAGFNKATIVCNKDDDGDLYAFVDGVGAGGGTMSAVLATAEADPFEHIGPAVAAGANVIYLTAGTHLLVGTQAAQTATNEWVIVQPAPGVSKAAAIAQVATANHEYNCQRFMLSGLTIGLQSTTADLDGDKVNFVRFKDCTFDSVAVGKPTQGFGRDSYATYVQDCDGDLGIADWDVTVFSSNTTVYVFEGCVFDGNTEIDAQSTAVFKFIGNMVNTTFGLADPANTQPGPAWDGLIFAYNQWYAQDTVSSDTFGCFTRSGVTAMETAVGVVFANNVIEIAPSSGSGSRAIGICGGGSEVEANGMIIWNNILVGQRANMGYNDVGTVRYDRLNWSVIGNVMTSWAVKNDLFAPANANRIGGWPRYYGVAHYGNFIDNELTSESFAQIFDGIKCRWASPPTYVDDKSFDHGDGGDGLGNGDYHPLVDSPQRSFSLSPFIRQLFDNDGNTKDTTTTDAGAFEFRAAAALPSGGYRGRQNNGYRQPYRSRYS